MAQQDKPFRVVYADPDAAVRRRVCDALATEYDLRTAATLEAVRSAVERGADCLVGVTAFPDGDAEDLLALAEERELPLVAFAESLDPTLVRAATRTDSVDLVPRGRARADGGGRTGAAVTGEPGAGSTAPVSGEAIEELRERIDERYRRSLSELSDAVLDASRSLMGAAPDEVDTKIEWELKTIGRRLDADRCAFYRYDAESEVLTRTHGWEPGDGEAGDERIPADRFPQFEDRLRQFESVLVPASDGPGEDGGGGDAEVELDVPEGFVGDVADVIGSDDGDAGGGGAATGEELPAYLVAEGFEAFCAVPVVIDWELYGVLAVGRERRREWGADVERHLRVFGEFVGHSLRRRRRRRELEEKNDRLERFASVVSHDLQNPINVITGYAQLVLEGGDRDQLTEVMAAADRMEGLIDDLLTLAREGEALGETERVDVDEVATAAWGSVDAAADQLRVETGLELDADPSRLQQVFENVFKNAIEHGGDDVTVRVEATDGGFAVEDDGPGIPEDERNEVFREGYTGGDGTGLGLSIVQSIVEAHGWSIHTAEGREGGARFEVETGA